MHPFPQKNQRFMVLFKNGDRSYKDEVFECVNQDTEMVVARRVPRKKNDSYLGMGDFRDKDYFFRRNTVSFQPVGIMNDYVEDRRQEERDYKLVAEEMALIGYLEYIIMVDALKALEQKQYSIENDFGYLVLFV